MQKGCQEVDAKHLQQLLLNLWGDGGWSSVGRGITERQVQSIAPYGPGMSNSWHLHVTPMAPA